MNRNRFDYILIVLMALMAFGSFGGFWQPVRIAELSLIPLMAYDILRRHPQASTVGKWIAGFLVCWWLWALVSLIWACDIIASAKYVIHLDIYMMSFAEIIWLSRRSAKPVQSLTMGWLLAAVLTMPLALWELVTDQHLPSSVRQCLYVRLSETELMPRPFAAGTFDNLNAYNVLLGCSFAALTRALLHSHRWQTVGYGIAYILIIIILLSNGSRGALLAVIVGLIMLTIIAHRGANRVFGGALLLIIGFWIGLGVSGHHVPSFLDTWSEQTRQQWRVKMGINWDGSANALMAGRLSNNGLQDPSRMDLWKACGEEIVDSHFLGVGAANYACALDKHPESPYQAPHNIFIEVLLQFGILIFTGFVIFLIWPLWLSRKNKLLRNDCLTILLILAPLTIVDSTFLLKAHTWIIIATLYVLIRHNDRVVD